MATVTVYRFELYDISTDVTRTSRRMGTRKGIAAVCGRLLEGTAFEAEANLVSQDIEGLTDRDFFFNHAEGGKL